MIAIPSRLRSRAVSLALLFFPILAGGCVRSLASRARARGPSQHGFVEGAAEAGIRFRMHALPGEQGDASRDTPYRQGCGLAVGDVDGDGLEDVYFLNQTGRNGLYRNRGDGTFEEITFSAGVQVGDRVCVGAALDDYDNDGDQDLFVTSIRGGNLLFENQGDGTFRDVTAAAGLSYIGHSQTAVFFDADGDGWLDLFVANSAGWTTDEFEPAGKFFLGKSSVADLARSRAERNLLYRNNGDGTFTDVTRSAGLEGPGWSSDAAVFDYDIDGKPDLLVTSLLARSRLYRNLGGGRFRDVTREAFGGNSWGAISARPFDADGDGRLDLFVTGRHSGEATEVGPARLLGVGSKVAGAGSALFLNAGNGSFRELLHPATPGAGLPWGIAASDFDNDGDADLFLPSGMGYPYPYGRNALLMSQGAGRYEDRAASAGIEPPPGGIYLPDRIAGRPASRSSRCAVAADFDGDGRIDLMTNNFNDAPSYYRNRFPPRSFVRFALTGTRSNRDAIGAVIRISAGQEQWVAQVEAAGGFLARSSKVVHFGLGDRTAVDRAEIRWPSGARQVLSHPAINRTHHVTEPAG